jgi:serine/threonine-protein kinase
MGPEETLELPVIPELDDYEFIRELGRGGTAVVYLARERELGRLVAIKLMHPAYVQDEEAMARLVREAKTISRLQHPNIVMLYGARKLGDRGYALILQYVPGTTVKQRLRDGGPFPLPLVERVLHDLGTALQYAHQHRIVHRDIKPENIFLDEDTGAARLADFGIARFWDSDSGLTMPGTAMGTPNYMSPEQVDGRRDLDGRSDIYSAGLVAWEMTTGRQPWAGETLYNVVYKQKHEELPALALLRPEMPAYFRAAIEGALKKNPGERWRDAGELLAALQNPYANLGRTARDGARAATSPSVPGEQAPAQQPPTEVDEEVPLGLDDTETIVLTRADLDRSWRSPSRDAPARPEAAPGVKPVGGTRRRPEVRPPGAPSASSSTPGATMPVSRPAPPKAEPGPPRTAARPPAAEPVRPRSTTPPGPVRPPGLQGRPPAPGPSKPLPRWLVQIEQGQIYHGPWMLDTDRSTADRNRRIVAGLLVLVLVGTIAGVLVLL